MKKIILIFTSLILCSSIQAQPENSTTNDTALQSLQTQIKELKVEKDSLKAKIQNLQKTITVINTTLSDLQISTNNNSSAIANTASQLGFQISTTGDSANKRIDAVDSDLSKNSLYGIIGVLSAIVLSGLLYLILSKKQKTDKTEVQTQLSNAKKSIDEEQVLINTKLAELFNGQMELLKQERKANPASEIDHSLAIKVADEIVKMQMNLIHMDIKVRGHKQLTIAVTNVFDNFKANGYEIVDLLNKPYNDGMNMDASKEPDLSLNEGEQIIRRIIKPEIHYNNKIIQKAQVIVAYGE